MLTMSPQLSADPGVLDQLRAGRVDPCAMTALAGLLSRQRSDSSICPDARETAADRPLRQLLLAPDGPPPEGVPDTARTPRAAPSSSSSRPNWPVPPVRRDGDPGRCARPLLAAGPPDLLEAFLAR